MKEVKIFLAVPKMKDEINELKSLEDFDIEFHFDDRKSSSEYFNFRKFSNINICDISYSDKIIVLEGTEYD